MLCTYSDLTQAHLCERKSYLFLFIFPIIDCIKIKSRFKMQRKEQKKMKLYNLENDYQIVT